MADLKTGDLIDAGRAANFGERRAAAFVYLTATLDAATWGAELGIAQAADRRRLGRWRGRDCVARQSPTGPAGAISEPCPLPAPTP